MRSSDCGISQKSFPVLRDQGAADVLGFGRMRRRQLNDNSSRTWRTQPAIYSASAASSRESISRRWRRNVCRRPERSDAIARRGVSPWAHPGGGEAPRPPPRGRLPGTFAPHTAMTGVDALSRRRADRRLQPCVGAPDTTGRRPSRALVP
jgi:hypothetical protein